MKKLCLLLIFVVGIFANEYTYQKLGAFDKSKGIHIASSKGYVDNFLVTQLGKKFVVLISNRLYVLNKEYTVLSQNRFEMDIRPYLLKSIDEKILFLFSVGNQLYSVTMTQDLKIESTKSIEFKKFIYDIFFDKNGEIILFYDDFLKKLSYFQKLDKNLTTLWKKETKGSLRNISIKKYKNSYYIGANILGTNQAVLLQIDDKGDGVQRSSFKVDDFGAFVNTLSKDKRQFLKRFELRLQNFRNLMKDGELVKTVTTNSLVEGLIAVGVKEHISRDYDNDTNKLKFYDEKGEIKFQKDFGKKEVHFIYPIKNGYRLFLKETPWVYFLDVDKHLKQINKDSIVKELISREALNQKMNQKNITQLFKFGKKRRLISYSKNDKLLLKAIKEKDREVFERLLQNGADKNIIASASILKVKIRKKMLNSGISITRSRYYKDLEVIPLGKSMLKIKKVDGKYELFIIENESKKEHKYDFSKKEYNF